MGKSTSNCFTEKTFTIYSFNLFTHTVLIKMEIFNKTKSINSVLLSLFLLAFLTISCNGENKAFTESARFERLSHFKDAGLVHHLNTVDQAMIADGIYRMFKTNESTFEDGYALWKNREVTQMINDQTRNLPSTDGPSHFILTAHKVLPNVFPSENAPSDDGYSCWGGKHSITDMSNAMYNWHRALC